MTARKPSFLDDRHHGIDNFLDADGFHATEIDRAIAQETRAALDLTPQDKVTMADWAGEFWLGGTKDGDCWDAEQCREMHCAGIVSQQ